MRPKYLLTMTGRKSCALVLPRFPPLAAVRHRPNPAILAYLFDKHWSLLPQSCESLSEGYHSRELSMRSTTSCQAQFNLLLKSQSLHPG